MTTRWTLTFDCADPAMLTKFWALALGYVDRPPPEGFESWDDWFAHYDIPDEERGDAGYLCDPDGRLPNVSFLKVPEGKTAKNRVHLDIQVGGGRGNPWEVREPHVLDMVARLEAAGGTVLHSFEGDHVMMADPEGNEFCVL